MYTCFWGTGGLGSFFRSFHSESVLQTSSVLQTHPILSWYLQPTYARSADVLFQEKCIYVFFFTLNFTCWKPLCACCKGDKGNWAFPYGSDVLCSPHCFTTPKSSQRPELLAVEQVPSNFPLQIPSPNKPFACGLSPAMLPKQGLLWSYQVDGTTIGGLKPYW